MFIVLNMALLRHPFDLSIHPSSAIFHDIFLVHKQHDHNLIEVDDFHGVSGEEDKDDIVTVVGCDEVTTVFSRSRLGALSIPAE